MITEVTAGCVAGKAIASSGSQTRAGSRSVRPSGIAGTLGARIPRPGARAASTAAARSGTAAGPGARRPRALRGLSNNGTASGDRGLKTAGLPPLAVRIWIEGMALRWAHGHYAAGSSASFRTRASSTPAGSGVVRLGRRTLRPGPAPLPGLIDSLPRPGPLTRKASARGLARHCFGCQQDNAVALRSIGITPGDTTVSSKLGHVATDRS
jgi:hypothetical protein